MHFTDAEVGLYARLLCVQWSTGSLPDDDAELASYGKGQTPLARIKAKFAVGTDGRLRNLRMEMEREKQIAFRQRQSEHGRLGGRPTKKAKPKPSLSQPYPEPNPSQSPPSPSPISSNHQSAVQSAWNASCPPLPRCLSISSKRAATIAARLKEPFFVENYQAAIKRASLSDFCLGKTDRGNWRMDFDFLLQPDAVAKIMEGKYDNAGSNGQPHRPQAAVREV